MQYRKTHDANQVLGAWTCYEELSQNLAGNGSTEPGFVVKSRVNTEATKDSMGSG